MSKRDCAGSTGRSHLDPDSCSARQLAASVCWPRLSRRRLGGVRLPAGVLRVSARSYPDGGRRTRAAVRSRRQAHSVSCGSRALATRFFFCASRRGSKPPAPASAICASDKVASLFRRLACLDEVLSDDWRRYRRRTWPCSWAICRMRLPVSPASPLPASSARPTGPARRRRHSASDIGVLAADCSRPCPYRRSKRDHGDARTPAAGRQPALYRSHVEGRHPARAAARGDTWLLYKEIGIEPLAERCATSPGTFVALQRKPDRRRDRTPVRTHRP